MRKKYGFLAALLLAAALALLVCACAASGGETLSTDTQSIATGADASTAETSGEASPPATADDLSNETEPTETNPAATDPNHVHDYTTTVTVPTCTEAGYTTYTCSCGDTYTADETEAAGHDWKEWVTTQEATEDTEGKAERTCQVCGETETRTISALGSDHVHTYTSTVAKEATCSAFGVMTYTCSCGDTYTENIPMTEHSYTKTFVDATCTTQGYTIYKCDICGVSYRDSYVAATGHSWSEWETVTEPTTTSTGEAVRTCSSCGATEGRELAKVQEGHEHSYTNSVTKAATCTSEGVMTYTCSCGDSYTESIPKTEHTYTTTVTKATCTAQGYTTHTCSTCGTSYVDSYTSALGHSYTTSVVSATCTSGGYTKHTCSRCGSSYTDNPTAALGHSYTVTSDTATCTSSGTKTETCSTCGAKKTSTSPATGHETTTETKEATCCDDGYTKVVCTKCGTVVSNTVIKATGEHSWVEECVADVAKRYVNDYGDLTMTDYTNCTDWNCRVCEYCDEIDFDTQCTFKYTDEEASAIIAEWINQLREEYYGTSQYSVIVDSDLIIRAKTRAPLLASDSPICDGEGSLYCWNMSLAQLFNTLKTVYGVDGILYASRVSNIGVTIWTETKDSAWVPYSLGLIVTSSLRLT